MATATSIQVKSGSQPDEVREFKEGRGRVEIVKLGDREAGLSIFEPGWRWSSHVKPIVQTDSCQVDHYGYCLEGSMTVRMNDGEEVTISEGDYFHVPPGHDAWVEGERCRMIDTGGMAGYASPA